MELKDMVLKTDTEIITDFIAADLDAFVGKGYFRFQCIDWEVREISHGMIYANAEEAIEDGNTILPGKSCVRNWRQLDQFKDSCWDGTDFAVLVFNGSLVGEGHDGEEVVTPGIFLTAFDAKKFMGVLEQEKDLYKKEGWSLLDFMV